jgi:glycosyltransferase involved in cell wall biosynthesis
MSNRSLCVEMVIPVLCRAGMEVVTANLAQALRANGHDVGITCIEELGDLGVDLQASGFPVRVVSTPGVLPNFLPSSLSEWFRRRRPDVVHAHSGTWLKAITAAKFAEVPRVILSAHGTEAAAPWLMRQYQRYAAGRAAGVVAVSRPLQEYLTATLGVPSTRVHYVPNGVMPAPVQADPQPEHRRKLDIPEDAWVVGCVARLHPVKNHDLLIDAFERLHRDVPESFLVLVGDGPCRTPLEQRIRDCGLSGRVRITGVVPDPGSYLRCMQVKVLSSHSEGLSVSLLEAMATGVPVVATAVGGTPDLLEHGRLGTLVPPSDAATLATALMDIFRTPEAFTAQVALAREAVATKYSVTAMARAHEIIYTDGATGP